MLRNLNRKSSFQTKSSEIQIENLYQISQINFISIQLPLQKLSNFQFSTILPWKTNNQKQNAHHNELSNYPNFPWTIPHHKLHDSEAPHDLKHTQKTTPSFEFSSHATMAKARTRMAEKRGCICIIAAGKTAHFSAWISRALAGKYHQIINSH